MEKTFYMQWIILDVPLNVKEDCHDNLSGQTIEIIEASMVLTVNAKEKKLSGAAVFLDKQAIFLHIVYLK